ncbi:MAG: hypothetical protein JNJ88_01630 [Planctomycetes bacterium]|nr:hypothetical protein [Planctomycetota bacterium]
MNRTFRTVSRKTDVRPAAQLEIRLMLQSFGDALRILRDRVPAQLVRSEDGTIRASWDTTHRAASSAHGPAVLVPVVIARRGTRLRDGR